MHELLVALVFLTMIILPAIAGALTLKYNELKKDEEDEPGSLTERA